MNTIKEQWEIYLKSCYPDGVNGEQLTQVKQAFYAGCLIVFLEVQKATASTDKGVKTLTAQFKEVLAENVSSIMDQSSVKNN